MKNQHNVAIFEKDGVFATLALTATPQGIVFGRIDPRQNPERSQSIYYDAAAAQKWFDKSVVTTKKNGWKQVYFGDANEG